MDSYIERIRTLRKPTFQEIRNTAKKSISQLSEQEEHVLWKQLNHGVALLDSHEKMCEYLLSYGSMHEAKIHEALKSIANLANVLQDDISIIDWGCGQGLATVCLFDYVNQEYEIDFHPKKVVLIDPSSMALDRAMLHIGTYLQSSGEILPVNKFIDDVVANDIRTQTPVTIHFFSNILDVSGINLKHLSQLVGTNSQSEQYLVCVSPLNSGNHRIERFYDYFQNQEKIKEIQSSKFVEDEKWTLKLLVFKLEAGKTSLINVKYYPPVQFHAAYRPDCINDLAKNMQTESGKVIRDFYDAVSRFELSAPFDIGASFYDDVHPVFAVLNNIVTRGLPTKASPFIEEALASFGNLRVSDDLGSIRFEMSKQIEIIIENENLSLNHDRRLQQIILSPIAVARIQKVILEALMTDAIDIKTDEWQVMVVERDVPCAAMAFEDLRQMFEHLTELSAEYSAMKFPKVCLEIVNTDGFLDSPLHLDQEPTAEATSQQRSKEYDLVIDVSVLQQLGDDKNSFSEFKCKNDCYFNIRAASEPRTSRQIYTSDAIRYLPLVTKNPQGGYERIPSSTNHLQYFLQLLFRKEDFRPGQLPILDRALQNKSVIGLLPTGGGKSLTYQLAAMLQPGVTIVVDPLNSLIKDQYDSLRNVGIDTCTFINSLVTNKEERERQMESSQVQIVFLSPERLCMYEFRERLRTMHDLHVYFSYGVIDEVHCVSEWGHDFRFSYLHLGRNLYEYVCAKDQEAHITLFGLTATASFDVLSDVERELSGNGAFPLDSDSVIRYENTNRLELQYRVEKVPVGAVGRSSKWDIFKAKNNYVSPYIRQIPSLIGELQTPESINNIKTRYVEREALDANDPSVKELIRPPLCVEFPNDWLSAHEQSGIVFCPHRRGSIGIDDTDSNRGIAAAIRNGLGTSEIGTFKGGDSTEYQDRFINNELPIMVATKAFGMGIDKPNVRFTVNVSHPSSLESFVQEAGRAGRDRKMALATILYSDFEDVDKDVVMFFHENNFKGADYEKKVMHNLLSRNKIEYYYINTDEDIAGAQKRNTVEGFLKTLLEAQPGEGIVSFISYLEGDSEEKRKQVEHVDNINKAIYRMCCIGLIDDFTQDYSNRKFRIVTKRKSNGEYYQGLKRFLMRYYSETRAELEIQKVPEYKGENEIHKCLGYLTEFIYDKIAVKRKRAIEDMRTFCIQGLDDSKDWKAVNEDLKDFIYFYFNSKYAQDDYVADNGEAFSLTKDTDRGKISSPELVLKYLRVIDDDLVGAGGTPKDNVKHLQGAIRLIRRSLTDANPALDLLNAFCLFYLGINNNESLDQELRQSYRDGLLGFVDRIDTYPEYWRLFEDFNEAISDKAREYPEEEFDEIKNEVSIVVHAAITKKIINTYTLG